MKENTNAPIYTLTGTVIHGRGIGKHVGTPTANMEIAKNTFLPKTGVYSVKESRGQPQSGALKQATCKGNF